MKYETVYFAHDIFNLIVLSGIYIKRRKSKDKWHIFEKNFSTKTKCGQIWLKSIDTGFKYLDKFIPLETQAKIPN